MKHKAQRLEGYVLNIQVNKRHTEAKILSFGTLLEQEYVGLPGDKGKGFECADPSTEWRAAV